MVQFYSHGIYPSQSYDCPEAADISVTLS